MAGHQTTPADAATPGPSTQKIAPSLAALATLGGSEEDDRIALYLKRLPFFIVWWLALLCHAGCAAFLCSTTVLYQYLGSFDMIYYNKLLGSELRNEMGDLGYVFVAMAALHFLEMLRMIYYSLRAWRLTFNAIHHRAAKHKRSPPVVPASAGGQPTSQRAKLAGVAALLHRLLPRTLWRRAKSILHTPKWLRALGRLLKRIKMKLLDRKLGLLGLESPYFYPLFLLRESVEIASQSYQMYQCSMLIADPWINNLFLAITVMNCWSTPILQHALARFNALERVICLTLDGFLDAGTCMLIPMIIVLKYVKLFDAALLEFPLTKLQDPEWFTALILENRMLFAMNKTDLVTSLMPHYSLFGCFRKVKRLIYRMPPELEHEELAVTYVNSMRILTPKPNAKPRSSNNPKGKTQVDEAERDASLKMIRQPQGKMPGWRRRFIHVFFIGWGATILAVHVRARQVALRYADNVACKAQLRPWFASSFMCASFNFDCVEQGNVATLTDEDLSIMDATTLSSLIITNCPALEMPDAVQNFSGLLKFMVYNATVVSWPTSASLNGVSHASLMSISVVATNMTAFPEGLQSQLPGSLTDVLFSKTNLNALPDSIAQSWTVSNLCFEYSEFTEFPTALLKMQFVTAISLAGNKLTKLPDGLSGMSSFLETLVLGDNPDLVEFPSTGLPSALTVLSIENTGVTQEPTASQSGGAPGGGGGSSTGTTSAPATASSGAGSVASSSPSSGSSSSTGAASSGSSGGATAGGGGMGRTVLIYANNSPLCESLGGVSAADNGTSTSSSKIVYCSTRDPSGVGRFPLNWTIEHFSPSA